MLLMTLTIFFFMMEKINSGYIYPHPEITFQLPNFESNFPGEIDQKTIHQIHKQSTKSVVSYAVPYQNKYDLNQLNDGLLSDNVHISEIVRDESPSIKEENNLVVNAVSPIDSSDNKIPNINLIESIKQSKLKFNNLQYIGIPSINVASVNVPTSVQLQSDFDFTTRHHIVQHDNNGDLNTAIKEQKLVVPKITKHIYFHVPPPEIDEPSVRTIAPKIKDYKIIFIKLPSQERSNIDLLEENIINQVAPIEEKTIIYVISKKPKPDEVLPQPIVPSQHEVFYVKYNGNAGTAITEITDNLEQLHS